MDVDAIYRNSIKWLAYTPLVSLTTEEKNVIVRDLLYVIVMIANIFCIYLIYNPSSCIPVYITRIGNVLFSAMKFIPLETY